MDEHRTGRVSEAMREELSELIGYEMSDPRLAALQVVEVHVSPDLRHAHVTLTLGPEEDQQAALKALEGARGFLRRQVAARLDLHRTPELHFALEPMPAGERLARLMARVRKGRPRDAGPGGGEKKPVE